MLLPDLGTWHMVNYQIYSFIILESLAYGWTGFTFGSFPSSKPVFTVDVGIGRESRDMVPGLKTPSLKTG